MLRRRVMIVMLVLAALFCADAAAAPFMSQVDSLDLSDSAFLSVMQNAQTDTVKLEKDRGYDASGMVNTRRYRPADAVTFAKGGFAKNMFVTPNVRMFKIFHQDYSFAYGFSAYVGKWFTPHLAARVGLAWDYRIDNFDTRTIQDMELTATAMFNLSSYLGGYNPARFCEISVLGGVGVLGAWKRKENLVTYQYGFSATAHVGANVNIRLFDRLNLYIEPQVGMYSKGMALSPAKDWRSYLLGFSSTVGVLYNFGQARPEGERISSTWKRPKGELTGYFLSIMAGTQFQNSSLVFSTLPGLSKLGQHYSFAVGRYFTDYAGMRLSGYYSENNWLRYNDGKTMSTRYMSVCLEGMFDVVRLVKYIRAGKVPGKDQGWFGCSLVGGPEMGRMIKTDIGERLSVHYVGIVGGIHPEFRVHRHVALFVEPRFSIVPYSASSGMFVERNDNRNYYDALFNFNLGMEVRF